MSACYDLAFQDPKTTTEELRYYLSFAEVFGLTAAGATFDSVASMLPFGNNSYGAVEAAYEVVFDGAGLRKLLGQKLDEKKVRKVMRSIVFANYVRDSAVTLADIGWCYAAPAIYDLHRREQNNFSNVSQRTFDAVAPPLKVQALPARRAVTLNQGQLVILSTLYRIEDRFVRALGQLQSVLEPGAAKLAPADLEEALSSFGSALKSFDGFDQGVNTTFAVFDQLIRAAGGETLRGSRLRLRSQAEGRDVEKVFMTAGAAVQPLGSATGRGRAA
jgi:hypothetical protein